MSHPLSGQWVLLRPFREDDLEDLLEHLNHPGLDGRRYAPGDLPDLEVTREEGRQIIEKWSSTDSQVHLAVVIQEGGTLIGHANAYWGWDPHCPDVELVISPGYQRRGFGTEAFRLLVDWVYASMPAHSISCFAAGWNQAGRRFLEKQGFQPAGISRREMFWRGEFVDEHVYDMLRSEWEALHGA